jgi:hypothetical protein
VRASILLVLAGVTANPLPTIVLAAELDRRLDYDSAFEGYIPFEPERATNWIKANERVGSLGGWRHYAREAQGPVEPNACLTNKALNGEVRDQCLHPDSQKRGGGK